MSVGGGPEEIFSDDISSYLFMLHKDSSTLKFWSSRLF